jgi:hypothetical protein
LNDPGLLGGDTSYHESEAVFVYDSQKLDIVSQATNRKLGADRVLWVGLVDPGYIYPDSSVSKTHNSSFTHKGLHLSKYYPLPANLKAKPIEGHTKDLRTLGNVLRRTNVLYSYDHYSNILREAVISGCKVRVVSAEGVWHDPRYCSCKPNINWNTSLIDDYANKFHDNSFVEGFIRQLELVWGNAIHLSDGGDYI